MSVVTISWNEAQPASTDNIALGPSVIQSIQSSVRVWGGAEHLFPSGGGACGTHNLGSARVFVGAQSAVSSADTTGRVMKTDLNRVYYCGSDGTFPVGGYAATFLEGSGVAASWASGHRMVQSAQTVSATTFALAVGFGVTFDARPVVVASHTTTGAASGSRVLASVYALNQSGCSVYLWDVANNQVAQGGVLPGDVHVVAYGTVAG